MRTLLKGINSLEGVHGSDKCDKAQLFFMICFTGGNWKDAKFVIRLKIKIQIYRIIPNKCAEGGDEAGGRVYYVHINVNLYFTAACDIGEN